MPSPRFGDLRVVLALAALVSAFLADTARAKAQPPGRCALLSPKQLEKALGQPFGTPDTSTAPSPYAGIPTGTQCDYTTQTGGARKVTFIYYSDPSTTLAKQTFDKLTILYAPQSKPPGLGDAAYIDAKHAIHVLKGKVRYYIKLDPVGADVAATDKQLTGLAAGVAAQI